MKLKTKFHLSKPEAENEVSTEQTVSQKTKFQLSKREAENEVSAEQW